MKKLENDCLIIESQNLLNDIQDYVLKYYGNIDISKDDSETFRKIQIKLNSVIEDCTKNVRNNLFDGGTLK